MAHLANGRIVLWQGGSLWTLQVPALPGAKTRTDFHAHHAIQVTLALDGAFDLHLQDQSFGGPALVVAADAPHAFEPKGSIALLFAEPESPAGRILRDRYLRGDPVVPLPSEHQARLRTALREATATASLTDAGMRTLGQSLITSLVGDGPPPPADPRVERGIAWVNARLDTHVSTTDLARQLGLSTDRMSHLFVEQTGLPFRTYLLWLRMTKALEAYAGGSSLTTAAHEAGFADSAHFSRTFRRMFGVAAAELRLA